MTKATLKSFSIMKNYLAAANTTSMGLSNKVSNSINHLLCFLSLLKHNSLASKPCFHVMARTYGLYAAFCTYIYAKTLTVSLLTVFFIFNRIPRNVVNKTFWSFLVRSSHRRCSIKKLFLRISRFLQENTCVGASF